jgi:hypothetical protein
MLILDVFHQLPNRGWELEKNISGSGAFALTFKKGNYKIRILDSTNFFKTSLASLGDSFKLSKMDLSDEKDENGNPYNVFTAPDDILTRYCQRDTDVLQLAVTTLMNFIEREKLGKMAITIAGQSLNAYRARFYPDSGIFLHNNEEVLRLEQDSYKGGRNECFFVGNKKEPVYVLDINSMYPYVMRTFEYPTKWTGGYLKNPTIEYLAENYFNKNKLLYVAECIINTNENIYGLKGERLTFPLGQFTTILTTPEIEYAYNNGHLIQVKRIAFYEKDYIFRSYTDYMYNNRERCKHEKNDADSLLYKYFMNTLYGKFAQLERTTEILGDCNISEVGSTSIFDHDTQKNYTIRQIGGKVFKEVITDNPTYNAFPAIASHVTGYARMYLAQLIRTANTTTINGKKEFKQNVYYVDTDSIFTNFEGMTNLTEYIDEFILGKLKIEYVSNNTEIRGLKDYSVEVMNSKTQELVTKDKIKGISKFMKKTGNNEYTGIRFEKIISALNNNRVDRVVEVPLVKELERKYTKGTILDDGYVKPFTLNEEINPIVLFEEDDILVNV